jgi:L-histidine Nalpha-methyltransferase
MSASASTVAPITIAIHTAGSNGRAAMIADVRREFNRRPRHLPTRYVYDERGCQLFDRITELPEYYPTRAETEILEARSAEIMARLRPTSLVELGAGSCTKTRHLVRAGRALGCLDHMVPLDISESAVRQSAGTLLEEFPGLHVYGVVGEFGSHLRGIPRLGRQLVMFLGSTIGNLEREERLAFLSGARGLLDEEDAFLLGVDLAKERAVLEAAYNDAQGVTAEFNRNLLHALNRELDADFDVPAFDHVAFFSPERSRVEMHLRSGRPQRVRIPAAGIEAELGEGEMIQTEISVKFTPDQVRSELATAGLELRAWFTDRQSRFGLALARPRKESV